ncbi:hypothetical protein ACJRO7_015923 [Eucalyptus globulus]|uniref:Uncharacterized protein n=1 Tax=Eucalyptus globulus TaxID=34317 RepID=A0ABD3L688_EUCGL
MAVQARRCSRGLGGTRRRWVDADQHSSGFDGLLVLRLVRVARIDAASVGVSEQSRGRRSGGGRSAAGELGKQRAMRQGGLMDARFMGQGCRRGNNSRWNDEIERRRRRCSGASSAGVSGSVELQMIGGMAAVVRAQGV